MTLNLIYLNADKNYHSEYFELLKANPFKFDYNNIHKSNKDIFSKK